MSGPPARPPPTAGQARPPAPGAAGTTGPATATAAATPPHPAAQVITNMHNLIAMDKEGKLKPAQILQCRNLIVSHTRSIVLKNTLERKTNPLLHLTPNLNVLLPFNGSPALISKEAFEKNIAMAAQEGQRIRGLVIPLEELKAMLALPTEERNAKIAKDPQLKERFATSVTWYTKGGADGFLPLLAPANRPVGAASGSNTPRPSAPSRPATPQQASAAGGAPAPSTSAATASAPPPRPTSSSDFKDEGDEAAPSKAAAVKVKTEPTDSTDTAPAKAAAGKSSSKGQAAPGEAGSSTAPDAAGAKSNASTAPAAPPQAPPPPPAPPVPVEPEEIRRKRKLNELLAEVAPGTQFEMGVTDVFSEVLSCFVDEAARGAAKLAKHRKSDKVGAKDMAYFLDKTYGITVPGFNVQVPQKVHTGPEHRENKLDGRLEVRPETKEGKDGKDVKEGRRRMVAPRAARYNKAVESEAQE